jgi:chromosome segregation ATPase
MSGWCLGKAEPKPPPQTEVTRAAATDAARNAPPVTGAQLALKADESAAQKALDLTRKLNAAEEEKKLLALRVHQLEGELDGSKNSQAQLARDVQTATEEVKRTRAEMQQWRPQMLALQEQLKNAEKENMATLRAVVSSLEDMVPAGKAADSESRLPPKSGLKPLTDEKN